MPHVDLKNRFIDPATGDDYVWETNHTEEEEFGRQTNIELTAPSAGGTDFVRQEGQQDPLNLRLQGSIFTQAMYSEMWSWWSLSRQHTIHFEDVNGAIFEVLITMFKPVRQRTVKNPRGGTSNPLWYWKYTIEMQVVSVISGWP